MTTELVTTQRHPLERIADLAVNAVTSVHTQRAYRRALFDPQHADASPKAFLTWFVDSGHTELSKATVNDYVVYLRKEGTPASSINQRLVAIRKFVVEAADNGLIDGSTVEAIKRVKGDVQRGQRTGNWLSNDDAQRLLEAPDASTLKGKRDRALIAVLLTTALRRDECARLTVGQIQQRDSRWVIVDLVGKRNKVRTVPIPAWVKTVVSEWTVAAAITDGPIFRPMNKGGRVLAGEMSTQAIYSTVNIFAEQLGITVHPHDLRRTFAKLAHREGVPLEQIQFTLGHESIATTERYLGNRQDLVAAPCDALKLRI